MYDFHTHSFLSDGVLSPMELLRRATAQGYRGVAVTDHAAAGHLERLLQDVAAECQLAAQHWGVIAIPGVELTHPPAEAIATLARRAKEMGARLVVVHGETIVEPVPPGTNRAALASPHVDILAHPGLLTEEEAELAAANGVFLELSARRGHCLTNGHVARLARQAGAQLLVSSDAHAPGDLLTPSLARGVALGAGLSPEEAEAALEVNPLALLQRLGLGSA